MNKDIPKIIGISGYMGSGKDTVARIIQELTEIKGNSLWEIKKFSKKLKQIAAILTGIDEDNFENQEFKKSFLDPEWNLYMDGKELAYSVREFLQNLGSGGMRDNLHPDVWINTLFSDYKPIREIVSGGPGHYYDVGIIRLFTKDVNEYPNWIISDVRFSNEVEAIKNRGGIIIRINRPPKIDLGSRRGDFKHFSETALDNHKFDYIINNSGSLEDLKTKVEMFLKTCKIL
jgi:hypothetical protein